MKNLAKAGLWLLLTGVMMFAAMSCDQQKENDVLIVVERQNLNFKCGYRDFSINIDVPIAGSLVLKDSVMEFLNRETYGFCEFLRSDLGESQPPQLYNYLEARTNDAEHFLQHYADLYTSSFFGSDLDYQSLTIGLVAQTDSFVTFGEEFYHCGGSCGSELLLYTFDKKDGHLVKEIVNKNDLADCINKLAAREYGYSYSESDFDPEYNYHALGLSEQGVILASESNNHYSTELIDYQAIKPYLTKEALELIKTVGNTKYSYEDWSKGRLIGKVENNDHETIYLMFRSSLEDSFVSGVAVPYKAGAYTLSAYTKDNGCYVLKNDVLPTPKMELKFPEGAFSNPSTFNDDDYFVFDETNNMLFVPYEREKWLMDYAPYKFDGHRFVPVDEKDYKAPDYKEIEVLEVPEDVISDAIHIMAIGNGQGCTLKAYIVRNGIYIPKRLSMAVGENDGFWLGTDLDSYQSLLYIGKTEDYLIRVDQTKDGYRYASWKHKNTMQDEPDLVITTPKFKVLGYGDYTNLGYAFENQGYTYEIWTDSYPDGAQLKVYQGKKLLLEQQLFWLFIK